VLFYHLDWDFDCSLHEVDSQSFNNMQNSQHVSVYSLTPETLHTV